MAPLPAADRGPTGVAFIARVRRGVPQDRGVGRKIRECLAGLSENHWRLSLADMLDEPPGEAVCYPGPRQSR